MQEVLENLQVLVGKMINKPEYLYHGSISFIEKTLKPKKATDNSNKDNCKNGIYATCEIEIAKAMSLSKGGVRNSFMDFGKKPYQLVCIDGEPDLNIQRFIYVLPSKSFEKVNPHPDSKQWTSNIAVDFVERIVLDKNDLKKYYRIATKEDIEFYKEHFKNGK